MIIGLTGKKRSGKSTAATYLHEVYGLPILSFADPVRDAALALDPLIPGEDGLDGAFGPMRLSTIVGEIGWDAAKEEHTEVRRTLQRLGTEVGRGILGENVWVDLLDAQLRLNGFNAVISDVRFLNEARRIEKRGGVIIRIDRPGLVQVDSHLSETELEKIDPDWFVVNDLHLLGSRGMFAQLDEIMEEVYA